MTDKQTRQLIEAANNLDLRIADLEAAAGSPHVKRRRNRQRPHFITFVRLTEHLLPGGMAGGQQVRWDTGKEEFVLIGSGILPVHDPLCITLATKCEIIPVTQQNANRYDCYADRSGPMMGLVVSGGDCGDQIQVCIGDGCDYFACGSDSGSVSDSISDSLGSIGSIGSIDSIGILSGGSGSSVAGDGCEPEPCLVYADYLGDGPISAGDFVTVYVERLGWLQRAFGVLSGSGSGPGACRIVARRACGNACDSGSADEPCVVYETDVRCEGGAVCVYKRAKELIFDGGRIVGCNTTDWMLQECCDPCDSGGGGESISESVESAGSCEPAECCLEVCGDSPAQGVDPNSSQSPTGCSGNGGACATVLIDKGMGEVFCQGDSITVTMIVTNFNGGMEPIIQINPSCGPPGCNQCPNQIFWRCTNVSGPGNPQIGNGWFPGVQFVGGGDGTYTVTFEWESGCPNMGANCNPGDFFGYVEGVGARFTGWTWHLCLTDKDNCDSDSIPDSIGSV